MSINRVASSRRQARIRFSLCWLVSGTALLLLTPVAAWTPLLGWAPALWLVGAPLLLVLVLQPRLPLQWLAAGLRRRWRPQHA